jgi:hypothetical protein
MIPNKLHPAMIAENLLYFPYKTKFKFNVNPIALSIKIIILKIISFPPFPDFLHTPQNHWDHHNISVCICNSLTE